MNISTEQLNSIINVVCKKVNHELPIGNYCSQIPKITLMSDNQGIVLSFSIVQEHTFHEMGYVNVAWTENDIKVHHDSIYTLDSEFDESLNRIIKNFL